MSLTRARQRRGWRWLLHSPITVVVLLLIVGLLSVSVYHRLVIERKAAAERREVESERAALVERRDELATEVEYLQDPAGAEREIRQYFDVAKDGEQVVVLVEDERPTGDTTAPATTTDPEPTTSWWRWLWPW